MSGYVFHCSKCKFAHAGECMVETDPYSKEPGAYMDQLRELVKALEAGSYNARPTKLHQCRQDGACGVQGCDPSVPFTD